ncbi:MULTISPECIES: hypothetical protein [Mycobacterium]|uniref:Uncharacterized protein n=2 Tax=Mycobacterium avium TaxID=1764 RepID=A0A3B6XFY9_MYCAV|nr:MULTISPECIES: hypothetical protein [Mycobacterium]AXO25973.1 hypothetical protein DFS55_25380 [Mycobacterium avium subsp. hominissuis]MBG0730442.1 hypothetical protein [Mycobacterium avium]MBZ4510094.1 hypothetical protein [Mycobacterium avium subsp. hominissuis]MBZ4528025.1 hypothetical protein [Mycobacterium avium subsp. hominissuis]MBZ4547253.1 hypothetical protein [Mycobacterium avium subsp. hominissuis]
MTARHIYIDETKERGYVLVASAHIADNHLSELRKTMREFVLRGQTRVHMAKESDQRRRTICAAICAASVNATIYDAGRRYRDPLDARSACLQGVISDTTAGEETLIVLEQDDSIIQWDRQRLIELTRAESRRDNLRYEHRRAKTELLLTVPDAIAWCWARGGHWRRRIEPVIATVKQV